MKNWIVLLFSVVMAISLTACGDATRDDANAEARVDEETNIEFEANEEEQTDIAFVNVDAAEIYDSVLEGDGSFEVTYGQYVYCLCNINAFTADKMPEGQNELTLTMK